MGQVPHGPQLYQLVSCLREIGGHDKVPSRSIVGEILVGEILAFFPQGRGNGLEGMGWMGGNEMTDQPRSGPSGTFPI